MRKRIASILHQMLNESSYITTKMSVIKISLYLPANSIANLA